ncbi:hypothetical protein BKA56DRAFT_622978 [Ilyonectria sp. MPI-CAGE-AT-0026]|nr:hypothetical protein BKA56DRAFT_622978 [Ilyonectria sp. MPI-CAGE-AT-0026]
MSQHTSRSKEPLTTLAGAPPLTYRPIAPAPVICVDPGANRAWSAPIAPPSDPFDHSFSADTLDSIGRPPSTCPESTLNLPVNWGPSPTFPSELPLSHTLSHKRSAHKRNNSAEYESANEYLGGGTSAGERETVERLTTLYVDPEDHPAYKNLQERIHQSQNEQDRWEACTTFHQRYKTLKAPIAELGDEIDKQRRKLEEKEAARDDKGSNLDALILLGTSFMVSKCERFDQIRRSYDIARRKRSRTSAGSEQSATGEDWADFLNDHGKAARELRQCEKALEYIATTWGDDKIRYYGWATKPLAVCQLLKATATVVPTWEEAGIKLNRLRNYRDRRVRNPIASRKRSISWKDLKQLGQWQGHGHFEILSTKMNGRNGRDTIPYALLGTDEFNADRLGFDKFGILVVKTIGSDAEPVMTFSVPPWGVAQSHSVAQAAEEQAIRLESLPNNEDEAPPATSLRGSARLAARQPTSYSAQLAPTASSSFHRTRKTQSTRKHSFSGESEDDLGRVQGNERGQQSKRSMVDAVTETDASLWNDFVLAKARALDSASQDRVVADDTSETNSLQQKDEEAERPTKGHSALESRHTVPVAQQATQLEQSPPVPGIEKFSIDLEYNQEFKRLTLEELSETGDQECWGAKSSRSCRHYLSRSSCPNTDQSHGPVDAHFGALGEAEGLVDKTTPKVPIFTRCDNAGNWKAGLRPTVDYLTQAEKVQTTKVYVQKYSLDTEEDSYSTVTLWELVIHFLRNDHGVDGLQLWNALELKNHLKQRHVPEFLRNTNCDLLGEMRRRTEMEEEAKKGRRKKVGKLPANDPLHFALIADGGMNTYPHSDSHGYSTFLTVQEGELIFGWLSRPDDETWKGWAEDPEFFTGGKWCYLVMKAGDSVYFPAGTPHYIVRRKGTQTFILGGHTLQWSNLDGWASMLRKQIDNPATVNEDTNLETTTRYVEVARSLIAEAVERRDDRLGYLGGIEKAERTLLDLEDLQRMIEKKEEGEKVKQV